MDDPKEVKANPVNTNDSGREEKNSVFVLQGFVCECGSRETVLRNYSMLWHDGDIHCAGCGKYIRMFDAG